MIERPVVSNYKMDNKVNVHESQCRETDMWLLIDIAMKWHKCENNDNHWQIWIIINFDQNSH